MKKKYRKLSEIKQKKKYAFCKTCDEIFIDDNIFQGLIMCPNDCGCVLRREYKEIKDKNDAE